MKNGKRILKVTIKHIVETDSPDTSDLGEYASRATSPYSIDRLHSLDCPVNAGLADEDTRLCDNCATPKGKHSNDALLCPEMETTERDWIPDSGYTPVNNEVMCNCGERGDMGRGEYRYFNPSFNYVLKNGEARPEETPETVRKYTRQDYERMGSLNKGHWCYLGIRAEAEIGLPTGKAADTLLLEDISSGGLWGIESDSERSYFDTVEAEELAELCGALRTLGFSTRAISKAFEQVEYADA